MRLILPATLVSQNSQGTLPRVLKSHTHHSVSTEQNMDGAVACTYLEPLHAEINERYYTLIWMNTAAEGTIKHITPRASDSPDGRSCSFCQPHHIAIRYSSHTYSVKGSCVLALRMTALWYAALFPSLIVGIICYAQWESSSQIHSIIDTWIMII